MFESNVKYQHYTSYAKSRSGDICLSQVTRGLRKKECYNIAVDFVPLKNSTMNFIYKKKNRKNINCRLLGNTPLGFGILVFRVNFGDFHNKKNS